MEYILYCDESSLKGKKYSDFFGGCIVSAKRLPAITSEIKKKKESLNLYGEIKWTKVTENYLEKYCDLIHLFFDFVRTGDIKVRIMFRNSDTQYGEEDRPVKDERYFKLYYQFLKHSFGFSVDKQVTGEYYVHFLMDELPDHTEKANAFKQFLCNMPNAPGMEKSGLRIRMNDIGEVRSHDHVLLQCTDVILGAMYFRLNRLHLEIPEGKNRRGKRTIAKDKLYQFIQKEIRTIHPSFNIGISTGNRGYEYPHWNSPYEHWVFVPKDLNQ